MASLKYKDPDSNEYKYIAINGSTPYINPETKNWEINEVDTGVRAIQDLSVVDNKETIDFDFNGVQTSVRKSVDQLLGLDVIKLSDGDGNLANDISNYDYLVVRYKSDDNVIFHSTIMCDEIDENQIYGLKDKTIMFPSSISYTTNANVYRIDGVRTADETTALEIANKILGGVK